MPHSDTNLYFTVNCPMRLCVNKLTEILHFFPFTHWHNIFLPQSKTNEKVNMTHNYISHKCNFISHNFNCNSHYLTLYLTIGILYLTSATFNSHSCDFISPSRVFLSYYKSNFISHNCDFRCNDCNYILQCDFICHNIAISISYNSLLHFWVSIIMCTTFCISLFYSIDTCHNVGMSFILNTLQIENVSLEQINAMKCNSFHYYVWALECPICSSFVAPIYLWSVQTCFQGDIVIVFILIIKVVCFLPLPYLHSHFISSNLEPNQTRSCFHSRGRVCFLFIQNWKEACWWVFVMNAFCLYMLNNL